jgi:hypothetical protein
MTITTMNRRLCSRADRVKRRITAKANTTPTISRLLRPGGGAKARIAAMAEILPAIRSPVADSGLCQSRPRAMGLDRTMALEATRARQVRPTGRTTRAICCRGRMPAWLLWKRRRLASGRGLRPPRKGASKIRPMPEEEESDNRYTTIGKQTVATTHPPTPALAVQEKDKSRVLLRSFTAGEVQSCPTKPLFGTFHMAHALFSLRSKKHILPEIRR